MTRNRSSALALFLLTIPLCSSIAAQSKTSTALKGRVTDTEDRPLAGAEVWLLPKEKPANAAWEWKRMTVTGEDGGFSVTGSEKSSLTVCLAGYLPGEIRADASEEKPHRIQLKPSARISGRVVDPAGRPIPGARVTVTATFHLASGFCGVSAPPYPPPSPCGVWEVHTDFKGFFRFNHLPSGWKEIDAYAQGYTPASDRREAVTGQESTLDIVLAPGAAVTGRVMDSEGLPVSDASIEISAQECTPGDDDKAETGVDGLYQFRCVMPGWQRLQVSHEGHEPNLVEVLLDPGDNLVNLPLGKRVEEQDGTAAMTGRISGLPPAVASAVEIRAAHGEISGVDGSELGFADKIMINGRFLGIEPGLWPSRVKARNKYFQTLYGVSSSSGFFIYLPPGEWEVSTRVMGRAAKGRIEVFPDMKETTLDLDFAFGQRTLSGRLFRGGKPAGGLQSEISSLDPSDGMTLGSGARFGTFRFEKLREGRYLLRVKEREKILYEQEVDLTADRELVIDLASAVVR